MARQLTEISGCQDYQLFLCNSGAESNENALKLSSFQTRRKKVLAFTNGFHGRTSAAVAATDNHKIQAPLNKGHEVELAVLGDLNSVEKVLKNEDCCAVIVECLQGIGGLDEADTLFYRGLEALCKKHGTLFIADEVQSGFGRTGDFFAFQKHGLNPDIISMAKGMGNGFPVGGILINKRIEAKKGMLGTTFGGNHLACRASLAVLEVIKSERLLENVRAVSSYFLDKIAGISAIRDVKGRGLMLGLEFESGIAELRKQLLFEKGIFTGNSKNPNLIRILPPLTLKNEHIDQFINALNDLV